MAIRRALALEAVAGPRRPAGARADGDRAGHPLRRHRQHGAGDPRHLGAARPRSAPLHADGVRRRGPLHAARLACELDMRRVLVPRQSRHPLRHGPAAHRPARRLRRDSAAAASETARRRRWPRHSPHLAAQAERWFEQEGIAPDDRRLTRTVDMRYHGQNYELGVALTDGAAIRPAAASRALCRGASPALRFRRRRRSGRDRHLAAGGQRRGAEGGAQGHPEAGPDATGAIARASRGLAAGGRRLRRRRRSTPASGCGRATASPGPRSSSRWTPPRWCRPA